MLASPGSYLQKLEVSCSVHGSIAVVVPVQGAKGQAPAQHRSDFSGSVMPSLELTAEVF